MSSSVGSHCGGNCIFVVRNGNILVTKNNAAFVNDAIVHAVK